MTRIQCLLAFLTIAAALVPASLSGQSPAPPAEFLDTTMPNQTGGKVWRVSASCADLQSLLDAAAPGDTVAIPRDTLCIGNYRLRSKPGSSGSWIVITVAEPETILPPAGTRLTLAGTQHLPKILSPNSGAAISTAPSASHYRIVGIEISVLPQVSINYQVVALGDGTTAQNSTTLVPSDLVFDRCYIHGNEHQAVIRGLTFNSARTAVINSILTEFHAPQQDAQAICGWNGPGPFKITNNFISASTENVMFGGALGSLPNVVPSDIEVRGNHFYKPTSWLATDPNYTGDRWVIKNFLELKNARRVIVEGNIFDQGLAGYALLFTVRTQYGRMPWNVVEDVMVRNNLFRHVGGGIDILARDDESGYTGITQRIRIENNVWEDVDAKKWNGSGWLYLVLGGPPDIQITHNTAVQTTCVVFADGSKPAERFEYTNNIASKDMCGSGVAYGQPALDKYFPGALATRNVLSGTSTKTYPPGNFFPLSLQDVGFSDLAGGNYQLAYSSPYKGAAIDGTDLGADISAVNTATRNAISGVSSPAPVRPSPEPMLSAITCSPNPLTALSTTNCVLSLTQAAPSGGSLVVLATDKSGLSIPASVLVPAGLAVASFPAPASSVASDTTTTVTATMNGVSRATSVLIRTLPVPLSVTCSPSSVTAGAVVSCSVQLSGAAGTTLSLATSNTAVSIPASVAVSTGSTVASFTVLIGNNAQPGTATLTVTSHEISKSTSFTILPSSPQLASLSCAPTIVDVSPNTVSCTVVLTTAAAADGASVIISKNSAAVSAPTTVRVASGATKAIFGVSTTAVAADVTVTLSATLNNIIRTVTITVKAAARMLNPVPGSTLSGPSTTFTWSPGANVRQYYLYVGNTVGGWDIYMGSENLNLSRTLYNLPTDGRTLYVRLWSCTTSCAITDYTYKAYSMTTK